MKNPNTVFPNYLICYIPENLDIDKKLLDNPPQFHYHRDKFVYIVSLIYSIPSRLKDFDIVKTKGFIPISATILQRRIHDYKLYLKYLIDNGIFITDGKSSADGGKSYWFKYTEPYDEKKLKQERITKYTLIKSILTKSKPIEKFSFLPDTPLETVSYLTKWFNPNLAIDMEGAEKCLDELLEKDKGDPLISGFPVTKYNHRKSEALNLYNKSYNLSIDRTSGRFHSPLTRIKKELRKFITYEGKRLVSLDLKNSQPFLSLALVDKSLYEKNNIRSILSIYNSKFKDVLKNGQRILSKHSIMLEDLMARYQNRRDMIEYKESVKKGQIYEDYGFFAGNYGYWPIDHFPNHNPRKISKNAIFRILFSPNLSIRSNYSAQIFSTTYPEVYHIFSIIKQGRKKHNSLACTLQYLEAQLIIHQACKMISESNPNIPIFTIHDSIVTTEEHSDFVYQTMIDVVKMLLGLILLLHSKLGINKNLFNSIFFLKALLSDGNKVLIVSKPHFEVIKAICDTLPDYRENILFRFTIGSKDSKILKYWEPDAPDYKERKKCLTYAFNKGFATSISCEPRLDNSTVELVRDLEPYVTDAIWIGKVNQLEQILSINGFRDKETKEKAKELLSLQTDDNIWKLYNQLSNNPKVKWKESIKKVVNIEISTVRGSDK